VKGLVRILLVGFALFMVLAIVQEWETLSAVWFGEAEQAPTLEEPDRRAAADTVHVALNLIAHLYDSQGDPRFADRFPGGSRFLEEIMTDIAYLERNHRRQQMTLDRLEIASVEPLDANRVEVTTREYWQIRTLWITGAGEADPPRAERVRGRYLLVRGGKGWSVEGWEVLAPEPLPTGEGR